MYYRIFAFCAIFVVCCAHPVFSQSTSDGYSAYLNPESVEKYTDLRNPGKIYAEVMYASPILKNPFALNKLKGKAIRRVELVYSDIATSKDIASLNRQRLTVLYGLMPEIFDSPLTEWVSVKQTKTKGDADARKLFHGFVFDVADEPSTASISLEREYLKRLLSGKENVSDSTVLKVFDRHKDWKNTLVVSDVTGSMSPFIGQLLVWLKLHSSDKVVKAYSFFNDGDMLPDYSKVVGRTGGIYSGYATSFDTLVSSVYTAMSNGYGGDIPENNIEALIDGIKKYPDCNEVLLIADNYATPRDMELLSEVKKPVRVILCGTSEYINPAYLEIALATGGSLHTMERDIDDLVKKLEGEEIAFGDRKYKVVGGKFKVVY